MKKIEKKSNKKQIIICSVIVIIVGLISYFIIPFISNYGISFLLDYGLPNDQNKFNKFLDDYNFTRIYDYINSYNQSTNYLMNRGFDKISYKQKPSVNYYYKYSDETILYSDDEGIYVENDNYVYYPLKQTIFIYDPNTTTIVKYTYDVKNDKCYLYGTNDECPTDEFDKIKNDYHVSYVRIIDSFNGDLNNVIIK